MTNIYREPAELICLTKVPPDFKPRLRLHLKLWHCASKIPRVIGYGYTARAAYEEWQSLAARS